MNPQPILWRFIVKLIALERICGIVLLFPILMGCKAPSPRLMGDAGIRPPLSNKAAEIELLNGIKIGAPVSNVTALIDGAYAKVDSMKYIARHPFSQLIPNTHQTNCSIWESKTIQANGWPALVLAIFSDLQQTNLTDALWITEGDVRPLVRGLYSTHIAALMPGDTVQKLFSVLGHRQADYFQDAKGRWRVLFEYWDVSGTFILVEADAADGRILSIRNATI